MIELAIIAGISAILFSVYLAFYIKKQNLGTEKMREIYLAIKEGSRAYLKRQFKTVGTISAVLMVVLYLAFDLGRFPFTSLAFILGVLCSFTAGYLSMEVATEANSRTAYASLSSLDRTLKIAFYGGMVMGLF
ncbi:sodium-translocating pyrophosphatase, partial [Candidatus Bathyarchaeota archaeon]